MAVGRIARYKNTPCAVIVCQSKSQIPKADVLKIHFKFGTYGLVQVGTKVEVVCRGPCGYRRMKKPSIAKINTAKELPVAFEIWMQHVVKRLAWVAF